MLMSALALPLFWAVFLWLLPWLEQKALAVDDRAESIERLLKEETPDEIERQVAALLAGAADKRRLRRSSSSGAA